MSSRAGIVLWSWASTAGSAAESGCRASMAMAARPILPLGTSH